MGKLHEREPDLNFEKQALEYIEIYEDRFGADAKDQPREMQRMSRRFHKLAKLIDRTFPPSEKKVDVMYELYLLWNDTVPFAHDYLYAARIEQARNRRAS